MDQSLGNLKTFRSTTEHGLDGKGRLNIPARFRDVLDQAYDDKSVVVTPPWEKCLRVYPLQEWAQLEKKLLQRAADDPSARKMVHYLITESTETKLDKNGRILLPIGQRQDANLEKEVVLAGVVKYFEIWDKSIHDAEHQITAEDFNTVVDLGYI